jgi:hypothetical protein
MGVLLGDVAPHIPRVFWVEVPPINLGTIPSPTLAGAKAAHVFLVDLEVFIQDGDDYMAVLILGVFPADVEAKMNTPPKASTGGEMLHGFEVSPSRKSG